MTDHEHHEGVLPQCGVLFEGIGRDLKDIKGTMNRLLWWVLGLMTVIAGGAFSIVVAMLLKK